MDKDERCSDISPEPSTSSGVVRKSSRPPVKRVLDSRKRDFQDSLYDLVQETLEDELDEDLDDSDQDPDYIEESDHDSISEQSGDECTMEGVRSNGRVDFIFNSPVVVDSMLNEVTPTTSPDANNLSTITNADTDIPNTVRDGPFYYGRRTKEMIKKKIPHFRWRKNPANQAVRTRAENIITQLPGLKARASNLGTNPDIEEIWQLLISNDILDEIVHWTNRKIDSLRQKYDKSHFPSFVNDMDEIELKGFIGLLIYSAAVKAGNESVDSLFATDGTGREIFRVVMSKERFLFILQALRFDNQKDRDERKKDM